MTAERIVRALAAADPIYEGAYLACALCLGKHEPSAEGAELLAEHDPDCPWRLAWEWCVAQDAFEQKMAAARAAGDEALAHLEAAAGVDSDPGESDWTTVCPDCGERFTEFDVAQPSAHDYAKPSALPRPAPMHVRCAQGHEHGVAEAQRIEGAVSFRLGVSEPVPWNAEVATARLPRP